VTSEKPTGAPRPIAPAAFAGIDALGVRSRQYALSRRLRPLAEDRQRITLWMMDRYGLDGISARAIQKFYYKHYGTTLRGLMETDGIDPETFLAFVHDIDRTSIVAAPVLAATIKALPGRKLILTNGSRMHAEKTAEALGLSGLFEDVFDIVSGDLVPKPERQPYERFLARHGVEPARAAMFEDIPRNLVVPKTLGMTTVLVVPPPDVLDTREAFEIVSEAVPAHIDFVTADLAGFLGALPVERHPSRADAVPARR
jgi:pyrimidine 5''-nucleotidase